MEANTTLTFLPRLLTLHTCSTAARVKDSASPLFVGSMRVSCQKGYQGSFRNFGNEAILERINAGQSQTELWTTQSINQSVQIKSSGIIRIVMANKISIMENFEYP